MSALAECGGAALPSAGVLLRESPCPISATRRCSRTATTRRRTASSKGLGSATDTFRGERVLTIDAAALTRLAFEAVRDVSHLFRPGHLAQLKKILEDPEASVNDRFVALNMLRNACVSAGMVLPSCQDTGTAIVLGKKGQRVWTSADDETALARGIFDVYQQTNLRYSQMAPLSTFEEKNTGTNLPAQLELYATAGDEYRFLFVTKGGGSANKSFLYQETAAILSRERLLPFIEQKVKTLGTAACPPYHLAIVIGGTSAELTMKTVKLASCRDLDDLPTRGDPAGHAIRDPELEDEIWTHDPAARDRRAVRRQVLLPRRARDPPAASRREPADRHRRLVLRRPSGEGQDHRATASSSSSWRPIPRTISPISTRSSSRATS